MLSWDTFHGLSTNRTAYSSTLHQIKFTSENDKENSMKPSIALHTSTVLVGYVVWSKKEEKRKEETACASVFQLNEHVERGCVAECAFRLFFLSKYYIIFFFLLSSCSCLHILNNIYYYHWSDRIRMSEKKRNKILMAVVRQRRWWYWYGLKCRQNTK